MSTEPENKWNKLDWLKSSDPVTATTNHAVAPVSRQPYVPPALQSTDGSGKASGPLYSPTAVLIATLLGAPIAGAAVLAINYRRLGDKRRSMMTMHQDAMQKAARGVTTLEEILRVSSGDSEE